MRNAQVSPPVLQEVRLRHRVRPLSLFNLPLPYSDSSLTMWLLHLGLRPPGPPREGWERAVERAQGKGGEEDGDGDGGIQ